MGAARSGDVARAKLLAEGALSEGGDTAALNAFLGMLQARSGDLAAAARHLQAAHEARPTDTTIACNLIAVLIDKGDLAAALAVATADLARTDPTLRIARYRGFVAQSLEDFPPAVEAGAPAVTGARPRRFWYELAIVLWLYFLYDIINNLSPVSRSQALANARDILDVERALGLDIEKPINEWLVRHDLLGSLLANFYNLAHIWLTLAIIIFLWVKRRDQYADLRNALVLFNPAPVT